MPLFENIDSINWFLVVVQSKSNLWLVDNSFLVSNVAYRSRTCKTSGCFFSYLNYSDFADPHLDRQHQLAWMIILLIFF